MIMPHGSIWWLIKNGEIMLSWDFISQVGLGKWAVRSLIRQLAKRVLKKGISFELPTGLTYYAPLWDPSGSEVYVTNADMDWGSEKLFSQTLESNGTFIDVGAHTGYYSLYMLPCVTWVYAYEPDAQSYEVLERNSMQSENIFPYCYAVSSQSGVMDIEVKGGGFTFIKGTSSMPFSPERTDRKQIKVISIDDHANEYRSAVTGIKIDVDGPDLDVLEGALETIKKFKPVVLIELSSNETDRLFDICADIGYWVYAFARKQDCYKDLTFMSLSRICVDEVETKMLFLAPEDKKPLFDDFCG